MGFQAAGHVAPTIRKGGRGMLQSNFYSMWDPNHGVVLPPCHMDPSMPVGPINLENASQTCSDDSEAHH